MINSEILRVRSIVRPLFAAALVLCLLFAAGCNGSQLTNTSLVRFVNACPNGGTAGFLAGGSAYGNEPFFAATPYYAASISTPNFSFTLSSQPTTVYTPATISLSAGQSYSAVVVGRADITTTTDVRYPQMQIVQDTTNAPPSGDINLRIVNAAPDLTSATVLVNSILEANAVAYPSFGSYFNVAAGSLNIQANQTGAGQVAGQTFTNITSGHSYTAFVVEPTVGTSPTYGLELLDDTTDLLITNARGRV
jgi:hypothetical protein